MYYDSNPIGAHAVNEKLKLQMSQNSQNTKNTQTRII